MNTHFAPYAPLSIDMSWTSCLQECSQELPGSSWIKHPRNWPRSAKPNTHEKNRKKIAATVYPNISQSKLLLLNGICIRHGHLRLHLFKPLGFHTLDMSPGLKGALHWPTVWSNKAPQIDWEFKGIKGIGHGWSCETKDSALLKSKTWANGWRLGDHNRRNGRRSSAFSQHLTMLHGATWCYMVLHGATSQWRANPAPASHLRKCENSFLNLSDIYFGGLDRSCK